MAKTYCMCRGMRGEATRRGGNAGVRVAAQSYDGSVVVSNWYDGAELKVRVGTNDGSDCDSDWRSSDFVGTFDEFKALLKLSKDIRDGRVSVVRHRRIKE